MDSPLNDVKIKQINDMLSQRPDYNIEQIHGQRIYRSNQYDSQSQPGRGCEVFVGRLPRDCYEDELVPVFESVGPIHQLRLLMDFSGTNRGYAFVQYADHETTLNAVKRLDGANVRENHTVGVMLSWEKTRLFVGGIPKEKKEHEVLREIRRVTKGVSKVILYMSVYNNKNRGFCFVEYDSHYEAMMAKSKLHPGFKLFKTHEVRVDWADPEPEVDEEIMKQVRVIYVRNLSVNVEECELKSIFGFDGLHIERVKKIRDFAFVHYETRADTEKAYAMATDPEFVKINPNLRRIQVSYARPQRPARLRTKSLSVSESLPSQAESMTAPNTTIYMPDNSYYKSPVYRQFQYYRDMSYNATPPNNVPIIPAAPQMVPIPKYETGLNDKANNNCCVIWVPVVWMPNKQPINNSVPYPNNNLFNIS